MNRGKTAVLVTTMLMLAIWAPGAQAQAGAPPSPLGGAVADLKQSLAANQAALARYTWVQKTTISVNGEQKSQEVEQVRVGPDGQDQKTVLVAPPPPPKERGLRGKIAEEKEGEMKQYIQGMTSLAMQYVKPAPGAIQAAFAAGKAMAGPAPQPGLFDVVITGFVKPGDSMTIALNRQAMAIASVAAKSYLSDQSDPMSLNLTFQRLPDGTNYMANGNIIGQSKNVTVNIQNTNFQKLAN